MQLQGAPIQFEPYQMIANLPKWVQRSKAKNVKSQIAMPCSLANLKFSERRQPESSPFLNEKLPESPDPGLHLMAFNRVARF